MTTIEGSHTMPYTIRYSGITITPGLLDAARRIIANSPATVYGPDGIGEPILTLDLIALNAPGTRRERGMSFAIDSGAPGERFSDLACRSHSDVALAILVAAFVQDASGAVRLIGEGGGIEPWFGGISLYERSVYPLTSNQRVILNYVLR